MNAPLPTPAPSTESPASSPAPQLAPSADPEFKPVSIQHLAGSSCACCYYNSSTPGCSAEQEQT